jgi:hypothetical protein
MQYIAQYAADPPCRGWLVPRRRGKDTLIFIGDVLDGNIHGARPVKRRKRGLDHTALDCLLAGVP